MNESCCDIVTCIDSENVICMQSNRHVQASLLTALKTDDKFCDVSLFGVPTLTMQASAILPIRAHKNVLAYASKHLYDLFTSDDFTDSHQAECKIENVDHESLRLIVDFIYTDKLTMTKDNAADMMRRVLVGAKYLLMTKLADACETFIADDSRIDLLNCVSLWCFARKYSCLTLMNATSTLIAKNIADMPKHAEFLAMPYDDCAKLLLSEAFVAADDDARCVAAIAWLNNHDSRASHIHDILNMIPLVPGAISISTALGVHKCDILQKFVPEVASNLMAGVLERLEQDLSVVDRKNRPSRGKWYVIGGAFSSNLFLSYDVEQRSWTKLPPLSVSRSNAGVCAVTGRVFVLGGDKDYMRSVDIDEYSPLTKTWIKNQSQLYEARSHLSACCDGKYAYAIGGYNGDYIASVERYDFKSNEVTRMADMNSRLTQAAAVFASKSNSIFVVGGFDSSKWTLSIEKYDILNNKWLKVGNMVDSRGGGAAALSGDDMYIAGGNAGKRVEIFNINTCQSRMGPSLLETHVGCGATTMSSGNIVCVIGGCSRAVECYDIREGKWTTGVIVPDMPEAAKEFGFAAF